MNCDVIQTNPDGIEMVTAARRFVLSQTNDQAHRRAKEDSRPPWGFASRESIKLKYPLVPSHTDIQAYYGQGEVIETFGNRHRNTLSQTCACCRGGHRLERRVPSRPDAAGNDKGFSLNGRELRSRCGLERRRTTEKRPAPSSAIATTANPPVSREIQSSAHRSRDLEARYR